MSDENTSTPQGGGEGNEPQVEVRQPDGTRRFASPTEARLYREATAKAGVNMSAADAAKLDEIRKQDDAAQAKEAEARARGEQSWDDLEARTKDDGQPTELSVPEETPRDHVERIEGYLTELTPMAQEARIPVSELQDIVDYAVSLGVSDVSRIDYAGNPEASIAVLKRTYGEEGADKIIADARAAVRSMPRSVADWLDSTGLGDDPSTLQALAAWKRGDLRMSASKAQAELDRLTKDPKSDYRNANAPGHKAAVARANVLYKALAKADAKKSSEPAKAKTPAQSAGAKRNADLAAQLKAVNADPDIRRRDSPRFKELTARARSLYEQLYGNEVHEA